MSEIAIAWSALEPNKGLEILSQIEPKEIRIQTLRRMAKQSNSSGKEEVNRLLKQATQEALEIDGLKERIKSLKEIANDWVAIDKEQAKTVYRMAYCIVEKAVF